MTRGTGVVALVLLTIGLVLGVMGSTRWKPRRVPRFLVFGLHRNVTLLAVAFVGVHVVTTVADKFAPIGYKDAVIPFLSPYRPIWLGLGAVAFDLLLALVVTSLVRARIGVRSWRAVHWLAYASWPVALVHTLGTGSDARTSWLALFAFGCTAVVVLAVVWRVATAPSASTRARAGAAVTALAVPLAIVVWAASGPFQKGWAARAGTPRSLLGVARPVGSAASLTAPAPTQVPLPSGRFDATFTGRITNSQAGSGLVVVSIDGAATGGFEGRVHVALRGVPIAGGGVEMLASRVGLLPRGATAWYPGTVVGLEGQRVSADVAASNGHHIHVLLALHIDAASGRVTGAIHGGRGNGTGPSE
ncbi:MAG: ferric reductase-like transmembrane domain-containing protein [Gaiellaceae bacterium]